MTSAKKIPLWLAIIININIVVGGGFFISASNIFETTGLLASFPWIICGILLLPLVKILSKLSNIYPEAGGIYVYSKNQLGNFWGFISGWGYFIGTVAGNAMILHAFSSLAQEMSLLKVSPLFTDITFAIIFTFLNLMNVTILERMHILFSILKIIPIALAIISFPFLFNMPNIINTPIKPFGLISSMPIALFAYIGIEACCAITHEIKNGKVNASKAMLSSLGIIMFIYAITQLSLLGIFGIQNNVNPFFNIVPQFTTNPTAILFGNLIVKLAILSSYLGGFYGMFYANSWNLYAIAKERKILFSDSLTKLNKHQTPWTCVIAQGMLVILFFIFSYTSITTLMTMSGFGVVIAYILSTTSYLKLAKKNISEIITVILSILGCLTLLAFCINDLINDGIQYLIPFLGVFLFGFLIYKRKD